ncbi:IclR family transcriptional regulator [Arthrobacter sp. ISL-28]|uniref:IclR family transcriptional regulator n=1 Tax=Arthrobacter sp. ISL-28 TaxID=2819108 RepID=UPI001BEBE084|nr:IclR family transcriptional regulator [Arthrobacter sp. ISL-28]MBT2523482.1 IclR family transcriptional regulator [Arthrobacter sp. ISL-28]
MANRSDGQSILSRYVQVLTAFDVDAPFLTLSKIARKTGLGLSTTHRLVAELERQGLLERRDDKTYRLGIRLWEIACRTPGALGLREIAMPHLQDLHLSIRQHVQLGILEGHEVLFLERLSMRDAVVNITLIGGRLPLHASSSGLVLLAHAPKELQDEVIAAPLTRFTDNTIGSAEELRRVIHSVRHGGYSVADGLIHPDARGVAVPVFGPGRSVVAAISAIVPNDNSPIAPIVHGLRTASDAITSALQAAYLPAGSPGATPGGRFRPLVNSSRKSMEYLAATAGSRQRASANDGSSPA